MAIDCMYKTNPRQLFPLPSSFIFKSKRDLHLEHHMTTSETGIQQKLQKNVIPECSECNEVVVFFPSLKDRGP